MNNAVNEQKELARRLITVLRGDEFLLYEQQIVPLNEQAVERPFHEILLRFQEEETKLLPPGSFLPVLEECGLMPLVDRWVVASLAKRIELARLVRADWQVPRYSINLSAATVFDTHFREIVDRHVKSTPVPEETFCFELAWDCVAAHPAEVLKLAVRLRGFGCRLAVGAFAGGEQDFGLLKKLAPDFVKLSPVLTRNIDRSRADATRLNAIVQACTAHGIRSVAEQVENALLVPQLRSLGVHYVQGFGIKLPGPL